MYLSFFFFGSQGVREDTLKKMCSGKGTKDALLFFISLVNLRDVPRLYIYAFDYVKPIQQCYLFALILALWELFTLRPCSFCPFPNLINLCFSNILVPFIVKNLFACLFQEISRFCIKSGTQNPTPTYVPTGKESVPSVFFSFGAEFLSQLIIRNK